jgi:hypothetical protein
VPARDKEDEADLDKKLVEPVYKGGDFFLQHFTPKGGFKSPVGEQAACLLDKASHMMDFHFCHDKLARAYKKSYKMDCDSQRVVNGFKDIEACCAGESHIPLWQQMKTCKAKAAPIEAFGRKMVPNFDLCIKHSNEDKPSKASQDACVAAIKATLVIARRLFKASADLYVEGHRLDVTDKALKFMTKCEPATKMSAATKAGLRDDPDKVLFTKVCRSLLATMWTEVIPADKNVDDDWNSNQNQ